MSTFRPCTLNWLYTIYKLLKSRLLDIIVISMSFLIKNTFFENYFEGEGESALYFFLVIHLFFNPRPTPPLSLPLSLSLSLSLSVSLSVCLSLSLSVCLSLFLSLCLSVSLSPSNSPIGYASHSQKHLIYYLLTTHRCCFSSPITFLLKTIFSVTGGCLQFCNLPESSLSQETYDLVATFDICPIDSQCLIERCADRPTFYPAPNCLGQKYQHLCSLWHWTS